METQTYNYKVVRQFAIMTVVWGIVGMLVGVIAAAQLRWPELNLSEIAPWFHFGRIRPLHTNAVILHLVDVAYLLRLIMLYSVLVMRDYLEVIGCLLSLFGVGKR